MVDYFDCRVSNLVCDQEFVELSEIAVRLEDVQQVQS